MAKVDHNKIKWFYDSKNKEWYTGESVPYANDGMTIRKEPYKDKPYWLRTQQNGNMRVGSFNKLSTAKLVAHHIKFG